MESTDCSSGWDSISDANKFVQFDSHFWPRLGITASLGYFSAAKFDQSLFALYGIQVNALLSGAVKKRQAEFLAGRLCAAWVLRDLGVCGRVQVGADRCPIWPAGIVGSISHCDEIAMAVALKKSNIIGVGIDIERRAACQQISVDIRQFASKTEYCVLAKAGVSSDDSPVVAFSLKESFFKAAYPYVGHYFGFSAASIDDIDQSGCGFSIVAAKDIGAKFGRGAQVLGEYTTLGDGFVATAVTIQV